MTHDVQAFRSGLLAVAMLMSTTVQAQVQATPGTSADEILQLADRVVAQLETGQYGAVWEGAAPLVRAAVSKEAFARQMQATHRSGGIQDYGWASIVRIEYKNDRDIPDGLYANVDYAAHLKMGGITYKLLSFRVESDERWHFVGDSDRRGSNEIPTRPAIFSLSPRSSSGHTSAP
ncbi:DUF4019 domain-containing protein [Ralstonia sp. ASV6]|uniref:DUF4019 domain-containing protein n=1 Tax=Ralstonia sp. ASV6 TaxID=2795124 RepID=UPI0018EB6998|nr:DUF4019 domain-containing protein [Ralstonia sp. ASV6]